VAARKTYEVQYLRDKRWTIDMILEGEEEEAIARARDLLDRDEELAAVKVVRQKRGLMGSTFETEIFNQKAADRPQKVALGGDPGEAPDCAEAGDLGRVEARLAISRLLRAQLDKMAVTPTELLYNPTYLRKLQTTDLYRAALFQVARAQAARGGTKSKARQAEIESYVRSFQRRGSELMAERRQLPHFDPGEIGHLVQRIRARLGAEEVPFAVRGLMCLWLMEAPGAEAKLDRVLAHAPAAEMLDAVPPASASPGGETEADPWALWLALVDEITADGCMEAAVLQSLFGVQPHLGAFLISLAGLLRGERIAEAATEPRLARIDDLLRRGWLPQTRHVLRERLIRELGSDKALDRRNPEGESKLLKSVAKAMASETGEPIGGAAARAAIDRRKTRLRKARLRALGMDDAADALG